MNSRGRPRVNVARDAQVRAMRASGATAAQIAKAFGITRTNVFRIVRTTPPPRKKPPPKVTVKPRHSYGIAPEVRAFLYGPRPDRLS